MLKFAVTLGGPSGGWRVGGRRGSGARGEGLQAVGSWLGERGTWPGLPRYLGCADVGFTTDGVAQGPYGCPSGRGGPRPGEALAAKGPLPLEFVVDGATPRGWAEPGDRVHGGHGPLFRHAADTSWRRRLTAGLDERSARIGVAGPASDGASAGSAPSPGGR